MGFAVVRAGRPQREGAYYSGLGCASQVWIGECGVPSLAWQSTRARRDSHHPHPTLPLKRRAFPSHAA